MTTPIKKTKTVADVVQQAKKIISTKDEEIRLLKTELRTAKGEKTVTFKMPDNVEVRNFPAIQKVHIENLPEAPKVQDVKILNLKDLKIPAPQVVKFPTVQDVRVVNEEKSEKASTWVPDVVKTVAVSIVTGIAKRLDMGLVVRTAPEDKLSPQAVFIVDVRGKPVNLANNNQMVGLPIGGGFGGLPIIAESLDQYHISDGDEATTTKYYGYVTKDGAWYIMKNDTVANNYRYARGGTSTSYTDNWNNRATITYDYFNVVF
jgi:hypothetical protein